MGTQTTENHDEDQHRPAGNELEVEMGGEAEGLEIELVDDTPAEDKGRKPLGKDALAENDEAEQYNEKFKKRIGELRHQAHDERRAREAAQRERDEAIQFARETFQRARQLEEQLAHGRASYAKTYSEKANAMLTSAKEKQRKAYEAGDSEAMAEAMAEIAAATTEINQARYWEEEAQNSSKAALQAKESDVDLQQPHQRARQPQQQAPAPDPRAVDWAERNTWFGKNELMTALAYGVHENLVSSGVNPVEDAEEYYTAIDTEMRRRFPEHDWDSVDSGTAPRAKQPTKKTTSPVAPVARTASGKPNRVVLTKSQLAMAERMGLTAQQYAVELLKLQKGE